MTELIIRSYFDILVSIGIGCTFFFIVGLYLIFKSASKSTVTVAGNKTFDKINKEDVATIAGDDVVATQLDLARAFIETNQKQSAQQILFYVLKNGNSHQKDEANQLLGLI